MHVCRTYKAKFLRQKIFASIRLKLFCRKNLVFTMFKLLKFMEDQRTTEKNIWMVKKHQKSKNFCCIQLMVCHK